MRGWIGSLALLSALAIGCGDDSPPAALTLPPADVLRCDITATRCQETIYASVAERVGLDPDDPPPVRTILPEQYESELRASLDPGDFTDAQPLTLGLRLMGLIPEETTNVLEIQIESLVSSVAAFYTPATGQITVIDRNYADGEAQLLLAHEFVHALQDREFGFETVAPNATFEDEVIAARSIIEGDAEHLSIAWAFEEAGMPLSPMEWDDIHAQYSQALREAVGQSAGAVLDFGLVFPYVYGREFMSDAILTDGLRVRGELWTSGPTSSLGIIRGYEDYRQGGPTLSFPATPYPSVPPGYLQVVGDRLGAWTLFAFLHYYGIDEAEAWQTAMALRGDVFGVFDGGVEIAAVWRLRFGEAPADPANVVAQALSARTTSWRSVVEGSDVLIVSAQSQSELLAWLDSLATAAPLEAAPKTAPRRLRDLLLEGPYVSSRSGLVAPMAP